MEWISAHVPQIVGAVIALFGLALMINPKKILNVDKWSWLKNVGPTLGVSPKKKTGEALPGILLVFLRVYGGLFIVVGALVFFS